MKASYPSLLWRVLALAVVTLALSTLAILIRDSSLAQASTQWLAQWAKGSDWPWSGVDAFVNLVVVGTILYLLLWGLVPRVVYFLIRRQRRRRHVATPTHVAGALVSDSPLTTPDKDELDRSSFVRDVVLAVTIAPAESSFVVAIEGPWGEGKTTILNWIQRELSRHTSAPIVVFFDPWPEDTKRGVVARLFDAIAITLNSRTDLPPTARIEASRLFGRLADAASNERPSTYGLVRAAVGWLAYPDRSNYRPHRFSGLDSDRQKLKACISGLDHRLVIIVDDLDRVDGEELRGILMAVNALTSFDKTAIVLAFDPQVVDDTLKVQGFSGSSSGNNFREKIVHVSLPLPSPSFADRQRLFEKAFEEVLGRLNALDHWRFWAAEGLKQAIYKVAELAQSPRSLKRLANHGALLVSRLKGEVNGGDVLLLELLRAHYAPAWYFVRQHMSLFDPRHVDLRMDGKSNAPTANQQAIATLPIPAQAGASSVFDLLFPRYSADTYRRKAPPDEDEQSRVGVGRNLRKYFHYGVEGDDITDSDARRFVYDPSIRARLVDTAAQRGGLSALLASAAAQVKDSEPVPSPTELSELVLDVAFKAFISKGMDLSDDASALLYRVIESLHPTDRFSVLEFIVRNQTNLSTSQTLLLDLLQHANLWSQGVRTSPPPGTIESKRALVNNDKLDELRRLWCATAWEAGVQRIFDSEAAPFAILFRMAQLADSEDSGYQRVQNAMGKFLNSGANLVKFASPFSAVVRGANYGLSGVEKLVPNWQELLERLVQLGEPRDAVEKFREALDGLKRRDKNNEGRG